MGSKDIKLARKFLYGLAVLIVGVVIALIVYGHRFFETSPVSGDVLYSDDAASSVEGKMQPEKIEVNEEWPDEGLKRSSGGGGSGGSKEGSSSGGEDSLQEENYDYGSNDSLTDVCVINNDDVHVTADCGNDNICDVGESIGINVAFNSSCLEYNSFEDNLIVQIDAMSRDGHCSVEHGEGDIAGVDIECKNVSCTADDNCICNGVWKIPDIPVGCQGKEVYAWAVGLYNTSISPENYITGNHTSLPTGASTFDSSIFYRSFNFSESVGEDCYISENCNAGDTALFSVSKEYNAHAAVSGEEYALKVCCPGLYNSSCGENDTNVMLKFSDLINAHVEQKDQSYYSEALCVNKADETGSVCSYANESCPDETICVVSISAETNAHVSPCYGDGNYPRKVCCQV